MKTYTSNRYPQLVIGTRVQFKDGKFATDDPELQALVEANDWYGVHIHPQDVPASPPPPPPLYPHRFQKKEPA